VPSSDSAIQAMVQETGIVQEDAAVVQMRPRMVVSGCIKTERIVLRYFRTWTVGERACGSMRNAFEQASVGSNQLELKRFRPQP